MTMNTYYLRAEYFATGEGVHDYVVVGQATSEEEFMKLCENRGLEPYFLRCPDVLILVDNLPESELNYIKDNHPILYKRITRKNYQVASFWWIYQEHYNAS